MAGVVRLLLEDRAQRGRRATIHPMNAIVDVADEAIAQAVSAIIRFSMGFIATVIVGNVARGVHAFPSLLRLRAAHARVMKIVTMEIPAMGLRHASMEIVSRGLRPIIAAMVMAIVMIAINAQPIRASTTSVST